MRDMDRAQIIRMVYERLATQPAFRKQLRAAAPDGSHPILVASPRDLMANVLGDLSAVGGAANVVAPMLNGIVVIAMTQQTDSPNSGEYEPQRLRGDCTLGVVLQRLHLDLGGIPGAQTYRFVIGQDNERPRAAEAQLVAVAG